MGNTTPHLQANTNLKNQLDEAVTPLYFNSHHDGSIGITFSDNNRTVIFPPLLNSMKVAFFNQTLKQGFTDQCMRVNLSVTFGIGCQVLVGFGQLRGSTTGTPLVENFDFVDITRGKVYSNNKEIPDLHLPTCLSGDEIELHIDMSSGNVQYLIFKSGKSSPISSSLSLSDNISHEIEPMVGVLCTEREGVTIKIIEKAISKPVEQVRFEESTKYGPVVISANGRTVSRGNVASNCCVLVNQVATTGKHKWKFKVKSDVGSSTCLGLAKCPLKISQEYSNNQKHLYQHEGLMLWRSYRGTLYEHGQQLRRTLEPIGWVENQTIVVEFVLDMTKGTLEVFRNERPLGVAFEGIKGPVKPAVVFYAGYEKAIEILDYRVEGTLQDELPPVVKSLPHSIAAKTFFDPSSVHGSISVSNDGLTVYRSAEESGNAYCLLNQVCTKGIYRWSFKIENDKGASTCIGITSEPVVVPDSANIYASKSMFLCRSFRGALYANGREMSKRFKEFWMAGTVVELVLDLENKVLQFSISGIDQGIAFLNVIGPYRPVVAFYSRMEKRITLQAFEQLVSFSTQVTLSRDVNNLSENDAGKKNVNTQLDKFENISEQTDCCIVCSTRNNNVAILPCKHVIYCPVHAEVASECLACGTTITGVWNIF